MKIFVTGCYGNMGKVAIKAFREQGWESVGFDIIDTPENAPRGEGITYIKGNMKNFDEVKAAMTGCDTVLHLAAYTMPYSAPEQEMFALNVGGTFNMFKACAELGIRYVTVASSPNVIGYNFGIKIPDIEEIPITTKHPKYTTDMYSYTKEAIENVGGYFYRRYGINSSFMHFGLDFYFTIDEWMKQADYAERIRSVRRRIDSLLKLPEEEAVAAVKKIEDDMFAKRRYAFDCDEKFANGTEYNYAYYDDDQERWNYYVHNFFMFLDNRDLARAFVCSFKAQPEGQNIMTIADHQNMLGVDTAKLAKLCYPKAKIDRDYAEGTTNAIVDYREAEKTIGFKAKYSFSDYYAWLYGEEGKQ